MNTTPVSRFKLSRKASKLCTDLKKDSEPPTITEDVMNTPSKKNNQLDGESDYSPIYFPLTQESNEEIDVVWDWQSPQTSQRKRRSHKRLIMPVQSPKVPLKRYPSNNQNQNFEKLKNELKLLQQELAIPDDEGCLYVSPQQEMEIKREESNINIELQPQSHDEFDLFNDSMDEELVLFSQKVENELNKKDFEDSNKDKQFFTKICDNTEIDNLINKYNEKKINSSHDNPKRANLDVSPPKQSKFSFKRTFSDNAFNQTLSATSISPNNENVIHTASGKLEFHRTKSFELTRHQGNSNLTKTALEEIERKRLEAKAKLELKKKKDRIQCSQNEIEKKRLQALAKLEAKRMQDIVEKKRQEALKKLQNRMNNASQVKSTLTTRL